MIAADQESFRVLGKRFYECELNSPGNIHSFLYLCYKAGYTTVVTTAEGAAWLHFAGELNTQKYSEAFPANDSVIIPDALKFKGNPFDLKVVPYTYERFMGERYRTPR